MAKEDSPFEGGLGRRLSSSACLGRVVSVDANGRRCRVKTIGMPGVNEDLDLQNVRFATMGWSPEGEEETFVPRVGWYGVVIFVGTEPFIIGWVPLDSTDFINKRANLLDLDPGDKVIQTLSGAHIVVRSGGAVQIQSTDFCRTFWIPSENLINSVCQNYELETTGGYMRWRVDTETDSTKLRIFAWDSVKPTNGAVLEMGKCTDESKVIDLHSGPTAVSTTGLDVSDKKFSTTVDTTGAMKMKADNAQLNMGQSKVALGANGIELLQKISDQLEKIAEWAGSVGATHTHIGNLGVPTGPPDKLSDYIKLQTDLTKIKVDIDTIKGSL